MALVALNGCGGEDSEGGSDDARDSTADSGDAGDSGDSGDSGDHEPFDVCGLLEPADLEAVFGSPFEAGEAAHLEQTGGDQCLWVNQDPPPVKQFSIVVMRDGHLSEGFEQAGVTVESLFEDTKEYMDEPEDVDLGDDAYLSGSTLAVWTETRPTSSPRSWGPALAEQVVG